MKFAPYRLLIQPALDHSQATVSSLARIHNKPSLPNNNKLQLASSAGGEQRIRRRISN